MSEISSTLQQKEKTAQFLWTGFILVFFLIQAIIWIVAITLTAGDKSHAVLPDYDQRAMHWNEEVALRDASQQLGWESQLKVLETSDIRGNRDFRISLTDDVHQPVTSAKIQVRAFHLARAGDPQIIHFKEIEPGLYSGTIQIRKTGNWQFEGLATTGPDVYLINERQFLTASK